MVTQRKDVKEEWLESMSLLELESRIAEEMDKVKQDADGRISELSTYLAQVSEIKSIGRRVLPREIGNLPLEIKPRHPEGAFPQAQRIERTERAEPSPTKSAERKATFLEIALRNNGVLLMAECSDEMISRGLYSSIEAYRKSAYDVVNGMGEFEKAGRGYYKLTRAAKRQLLAAQNLPQAPSSEGQPADLPTLPASPPASAVARSEEGILTDDRGESPPAA